MNKNDRVINKNYLLFIVISAALGGFLFGYDTAVISGTIGFVKSKFALDSVLEGWFVSSALVGYIVGVGIAGEISDRIGRKKLMKGGITGMFISLIVVGILFFFGKTQGIILLIFIICYIISFSIGYGPVIWVLLSEIYPTKIRGRAMSVATLTLWVGTAIIGQVVPWMLENLTPAGTFFVFAAFCIPVPFILRKIPETKGLSLEEIERIWQID